MVPAFPTNVARAPEEVGMSSERLARVHDLLQQWTSSGAIPGASLYIARDGTTVVNRGFGVYKPLGEAAGAAPYPGTADVAARPVQPDTIFLIASLTKPVVATALLLLVERGRLLLGDRVGALLPEFQGPDRDQVRVYHLLTHTSGLPDMLPENTALRERHAPLSEFVRFTCSTPLLFAPGCDCRYQSAGILLLGEIIERLAGMPVRQFVQEELTQPLGAVDTYLGLGRLPLDRIAQSTLADDQARLDWTWNSAYWRDLGAPWGGMHATAESYARFLQLFLDAGRARQRQIVSSAMARMATTDQLATMPGLAEIAKASQAWGLGWQINRRPGPHHLAELASPRAFGHWGATGTVAWADPDTRLTCVILTNQPAASRRLSMISNAVAATVVA